MSLLELLCDSIFSVCVHMIHYRDIFMNYYRDIAVYNTLILSIVYRLLLIFSSAYFIIIDGKLALRNNNSLLMLIDSERAFLMIHRYDCTYVALNCLC